MSDLVARENYGDVAVVSMRFPAKKNAMSTALLQELCDQLRTARADDSTSLVITGSDGVFSSGADVTEIVDDDGAVRRMRMFADLYALVTEFPKPTVAAIEGPCVGGGAEVASGCDLRVGTPEARIRFPGAQFGIPIGSGRLPLLIGVSHAKDLLLTARTVEGDEAYRMGFLNRIVPLGKSVEEAVTLAKAISLNPGAVSQKRILHQVSGLGERVASENRALVRWQERRDRSS